MDYNIGIRQNQLENFQQFIDSSKNNLKSILESIGWTEDKVKDEDYLVSCVYDKTHRVAAKNLQDHLKICSLKRLGYDLDDVQLSEPSDNQKSSTIIDDHKKIELFTEARKHVEDFKIGWNGIDPDPKTSSRFLSTYSADERRALYDSAITATEGPPVPPEFCVNQLVDSDRVLTYEERLERDRNLKRRRIKYKSVHTNHKNHTEVIREVIQSQMEMYEEFINEGTNINARVKEKEDDKTEKGEKNEKLEKEPENVNGSGGYDEIRSITSRNSTHSETSSHYKSYKRRRSRSSGRSRVRESRHDEKPNRNNYNHRGDNDRSRDRDRSRNHIDRRFDRSRDRDRDQRNRDGDRFKRKSNDDDYNSRHKKSHRHS